MKKILITGGAGFIGSYLANKLVERGDAVTVLDNLSEQIHGESPTLNSPLYLSVKDKVNFIQGDITNEADITKAIADNEIIVHLAAETGTGQSMYQIKKYTDVNIGGTALLLDILSKSSQHKVKRIVIASSRAIYGEGKYASQKYGIVYPTHRKEENLLKGFFETTFQDDNKLSLLPTDETSKIHPSSVYGITKQNQEQMVMTVCPTLGIEPVAFRYQNVYGPGQSLSNPYTGILSVFSNLIKNKKSLNIFEDGLESRDFVFIEDVVSATILGIDTPKAAGEIFNVGTGIATTVNEVAAELIYNYKSDVKMQVSGKFRLGDIRHNIADMTKASEILGFTPKYNFKQGIKLFTDWVETQQMPESKFDKSIEELKQKGLYK